MSIPREETSLSLAKNYVELLNLNMYLMTSMCPRYYSRHWKGN
jgi:hypothetical protein